MPLAARLRDEYLFALQTYQRHWHWRRARPGFSGYRVTNTNKGAGFDESGGAGRAAGRGGSGADRNTGGGAGFDGSGGARGEGGSGGAGRDTDGGTGFDGNAGTGGDAARGDGGADESQCQCLQSISCSRSLEGLLRVPF